MNQVLIVGGGASGVMAAIAASLRGARVTVLERNQKPLKKMGVTGNGRCNLLNRGSLEQAYFGNPAFARSVMTAMPYPRIRAFLQDEIGLALRDEEEGRVYPAALQASVVTEALLYRCEELGVKFLTGYKAERAWSEHGLFTVAGIAVTPGDQKGQESQKAFSCQGDRLLICAGGRAAPAHGTDGAGYALLEQFGHHLLATRPALAALKTERKPLEGLSGQRMKAILTLLSPEGKLLHRTEGEALFTDDGISGIAAMQLARFAIPNSKLVLDIRPSICMSGMDENALESILAKRSPQTPMTGWFARPVAGALERYAKKNRVGLATAIAKFTLTVQGVRDYPFAQVTAGGIDCNEFSPATLESLAQPHLYAAGEILDVDGDCGGYNLMFAFATGLLAGYAMAASQKNLP